MIHVSLPGEKGWETVPLKDTTPEITPAGGIYQLLWEEADVERTSPHALLKLIDQGVKDAVAAALKNWKDSRRWTLVLEGLHKLYGWHYKARFLDLQAGSGYQKDPDDDKISGRAYAMAHDSYQGWLHEIMSLPIPYVLGTIWEGKTKDDPGNTAKNAPTHIFPDLPGEMAKRIVGEFTIVLYSEVSMPDPRGRQRGKWTVKPQGKIWGVGVHLPPEIAAKVPATIEPPPNEWRACRFSDLEPHLTELQAALKRS
jgi:hypothetical protein